MPNNLRFVILLLLLLPLGFNLGAQPVVYGIQTSKAQEKLIDDLVAVSNFKKALLEATNIRVYVRMMEANQKKTDSLSQADALAIIKSVYESYNYKQKYYTEFGPLTEKELKALIKMFTDNRSMSEKAGFIFCPVSLFHNLENDINHALIDVLKNKKTK